MKPVVAVSTGDPFGVGPEICMKAALSPAVLAVCRPLLVGDRDRLLEVARPYGGGHPAEAWPEVGRSPFGWGSKQGDDVAVASWEDGPAFYDMADRPEPPAAPGPCASGGRSAVMYVKQAVALVRTGGAAAVTTAPISKTAMRLAGHPFPGHTELLAELCGLERGEVAMLFVAPGLKMAPITIHQPLVEAIASLSPGRIVRGLRVLASGHARWFGTAPRIGVCALNPHAGEGGMFGREEEAILAPAIREARAGGIDASGPFPADTLPVRAMNGEFDLVAALYHDQATIAIKTRAFGGAVNVTLGLPFLRTSVDHGTAYDIAGRGVASPGSLIEALLLAARLGAASGGR